MSLRHNQLGVQITPASAEQKIAVGTGSPTISISFGGGTTKVPAILSNNVRGMRGTGVDASTNIQ